MKIPDICPADDDQRNEVLEEAETVLVPLSMHIYIYMISITPLPMKEIILL